MNDYQNQDKIKQDNKKRQRDEQENKLQKLIIRNWIIAIVSLALAIILAKVF